MGKFTHRVINYEKNSIDIKKKIISKTYNTYIRGESLSLMRMLNVTENKYKD